MKRKEKLGTFLELNLLKILGVNSH